MTVTDMTDPTHLAELPSPVGQSQHTKVATFSSVCGGCDQPIAPEAVIVESQFGWVHDGCPPAKPPAPKAFMAATKISDCPACRGVIEPPDKIMLTHQGWVHETCPDEPRIRAHILDRPVRRGMSMRTIEHYTGDTYGDR